MTIWTAVGRRARLTVAAADGVLGRMRARALEPGLRKRNEECTAPVTGDAPVIVSLTSFGRRIDAVHLTIESIARGVVRPRRLILWLAETDRRDPLPAGLTRLVGRGLEIRWTRDIGPYKKIIPTLGERTPGEHVATADDDVVYPRSWLSRLMAGATDEPDLVHCFRAREVSVSDGVLEPYSSWPLCTSDAPGFDRIATGVSGVLYPPALLDALADAGDRFLEVAPRADDLWAHLTAVTAGIRVRQLSRWPRHFPELPGSQTQSLFAENVGGGGNDAQILAGYRPATIRRIAEDAERRR